MIDITSRPEAEMCGYENPRIRGWLTIDLKIVLNDRWEC